MLSTNPVTWLFFLKLIMFRCVFNFVLACTAPMVYFNCSQAAPGQKGTECQKICETLDSNPCVSESTDTCF